MYYYIKHSVYFLSFNNLYMTNGYLNIYIYIILIMYFGEILIRCKKDKNTTYQNTIILPTQIEVLLYSIEYSVWNILMINI